jgi:hypothetical protein
LILKSSNEETRNITADGGMPQLPQPDSGPRFEPWKKKTDIWTNTRQGWNMEDKNKWRIRKPN